jgi:hypothetical protein
VITRRRRAPDGLADRGRRLWRQLAGRSFDPAGWVLLEEACRIADRLDQLDRLLGGDAELWLRLDPGQFDGDPVHVVVDKALVEARQQANVLRQIIATLGLAKGATESVPPAKDGLDELRARLATRGG